MYTCTCTCTCTYTLVHTQTHKHVHTNTHIQIHTHTHTCTHAHVRAQSAAHTHTHTHTHTQTHAHARAHTHTHTHTNTHTHTHTHTYLQRYTKYSNNPNKCSNVAEMSIKMTSKYTWSLYLIQKVNCVIKLYYLQDINNVYFGTPIYLHHQLRGTFFNEEDTSFDICVFHIVMCNCGYCAKRPFFMQSVYQVRVAVPIKLGGRITEIMSF